MTSPRRCLQLSVRCPSAGDRKGLLADALVGLTGSAVTELDGWFTTYLPDPPRPDQLVADMVTKLETETGLGPIEAATAWQEHEAWEETWRRGLAVRRVGERIVVRPSWLEHSGARPDDIVIDVDPVTVGEVVLDVGAGTGILSVAAARLGAERVTAIEGEPLACGALRENLAENGVADRVVVEERWIDPEGLTTRPPVDGIVANLETGLLMPLLPALAGSVRPGGWLILSGILEEEWPGVAAAVSRLGLGLVETVTDEGWCSGAFRQPG